MVKEYKPAMRDALALGIILAVYVGLAYAGMPCPIRFFTGVSCAGCGMTRAWSALLRGDPVAAFHYHPLFPLPPVAAVLWFWQCRLPVKLYRGLMLGIGLLFLAVYGLRLLNAQDDIVVFDPANGIFVRVLRAIFRFAGKA